MYMQNFHSVIPTLWCYGCGDVVRASPAVYVMIYMRRCRQASPVVFGCSVVWVESTKRQRGCECAEMSASVTVRLCSVWIMFRIKENLMYMQNFRHSVIPTLWCYGCGDVVRASPAVYVMIYMRRCRQASPVVFGCSVVWVESTKRQRGCECAEMSASVTVRLCSVWIMFRNKANFSLRSTFNVMYNAKF